MTGGAPDLTAFRDPPREFGLLPFWFLNGELDPDEMRFQLRELRDKGMHGVVLHGRFGLEMPYVGERYLDRIAFASREAHALGLATWIYDEMNWPSGTADKRVLAERPDLAERYLECLGFPISGPWFMYLTGGDSRYLDFERSTPVAAFAVGAEGRVIDLTPNLSFGNVIPWEVPPGDWRVMYLVEKRADYYIDALDPEATKEFLRLGYEPYTAAIGDDFAERIAGFYSDEPAMHYYESSADNAIVPWTKDMLRRFRERNGYDLRPRLPDLFLDIAPDTPRVRYDFYTTLTEFYTNAYYAQIHEWCRARGVRFTAHLLYEEWLRRMIRVEGNLFRHYENMDVVAVDHLYPVIGTRESPDQHVAMKVASSAAHHVGSPRVICESFGGIFMDTTMQRMKWIADWECVLGVNLVNPHGFHYTLEGSRKRDWPPSMFYQYPWWPFYGEFSTYVRRVCSMLSVGRHAARVAVLWPITSMFATYIPQERRPVPDRIEGDFNALTDLLLRLHHDFDYLDERTLARSELQEGLIRVGDEAYELLVLPPLTHLELDTVDRIEQFVALGGRALSLGLLPRTAFGPDGQVDVTDRIGALFGVGPSEGGGAATEVREHPGGGITTFLGLPSLSGDDLVRSGFELRNALDELVRADIVIEDDQLFSLHRVVDERDVYFVVNPTFEERKAQVTLPAGGAPSLWDPSSGIATSPASRSGDEGTSFVLELPPTGSIFVVAPGDEEGVGPVVAFEPEMEPILLDDDWEFEALDDNALVIGSWNAKPGSDEADDGYAAIDASEEGWLGVVRGAWAPQVPGGPTAGFPVPVWFRIAVDVDAVPDRAALVIDGFAGSHHEVHMNGIRITDEERRSAFDSQMKVVDIHPMLRPGKNVLAIRLVVRGSGDGLLDLVKIVGDFSLVGSAGGYRIAEPRRALRPGPWSTQGYPFLSGRGRYRRRVTLPELEAGRRLVLDVPMVDDVLDVMINDRSAGVRPWPPYSIDVTDVVTSAENLIELTVANTPANLLSGVERPSGLAGPPRLTILREAAP